MSDRVQIAQRLYDAIAARDPQSILDSMTEDFVGEVSDGMPLSVGGRHEGRDAMLGEVWGPIFGAFDVRVEVERMIDGDQVVALGHYRGTERATGRPFDAVFAHVIGIDDGRVASLQQITDTQRWVAAAA